MDVAATLLALQDIDTELMRAHKALDEMPEKRAILETRRKTAEVTELRGKAELLVKQLKAAIAKQEDEAALYAEKFETEQARVMSGEITNPKEIQHLTRELDALRRRREKLDIDTIALMERLERAGGQVEKVDGALAELRKKEESLIEVFQRKGGEIRSRIAELEVRRCDLVTALDSGLAARYEELRASKGGIGAGRLVGSTCTACRMELPAERVSELLAGPRIATCPACRRLMVVSMDDEAQA